METFEEFLAKLDNPDHQDKLLEIFNWIDEHYPELDKTIKWNQPMYTHHGTYIIGFSTAKEHLSVSPEKAGMEEFQNKIEQAGYSQSKMLFRIKWNQAIHFPLIGEIIEFQIKDKADYTKFWRKA